MDSNSTPTTPQPKAQTNVQSSTRLQAPTATTRPRPVIQQRDIATPTAATADKEQTPVSERPTEVKSATEARSPEAAAKAESKFSTEQAPVTEQGAESAVENFVEQSPAAEEPAIAPDVKKAGVTHSGPGLIVDVDENVLGIKKMPMTYADAAEAEKKAKFKDSKHWLMAHIMYIWRKINPNSNKEQKGEVPVSAPEPVQAVVEDSKQAEQKQ